MAESMKLVKSRCMSCFPIDVQPIIAEAVIGRLSRFFGVRMESQICRLDSSVPRPNEAYRAKAYTPVSFSRLFFKINSSYHTGPETR